MKWLRHMKRDRRGREIEHLIPEMLDYVAGKHQPKVQYCIDPSPMIKYSLRPDSNPDIKRSVKAALQGENPENAPALDNAYHTWEKENAEYKSFSTEVMRYVKERFRKPSEFYRRANMDKRTFHKIRTDFGYKPSRMTAMRCCIGLKLNVEEAEELLKLAGMAFSPNEPNDLVVKFCLENGINDIPGVNYMLHRYAEEK